ncbi:uncharacterized protein TRIADDRAFT_60484 [Trichoplax adhaerens]|uniref:Coiled-coil domain-containing protein 87 n=1 Tax=Trichoplax adhaerens TaxID=10228 RepID=B3S8C1_TRIAD|nr:hypothetical protein TRIADDRAFT_60484 [Trichoplax adhaerens]EDV21075.1 hypothetical protein TRIADDRAFT_60484 [Trichoplax adhaerens]|eukprot:XP_002116405.1 hypothetical protein TRIADDRAFT_60484 [Trichoplax adhaerens]
MEGLDKLYPLENFDISEKDFQDKFITAAGPISLFATGNDSDDIAAELQHERTLTPIQDALVSLPASLNNFLQILRPRIRPKGVLEYLTVNNQQEFVTVITGEISNIWPDLQDVAHDPYLDEESNFQLKRRIMMNIIITAEELFHKYLDSAETLNKRGVFSAAANSSRLQAQLAIEAHKRFNVLALRRVILAEMKAEQSLFSANINNEKVKRERGFTKLERRDFHLEKSIEAEVNELKSKMPSIPKHYQHYDELSALYGIVESEQSNTGIDVYNESEMNEAGQESTFSEEIEPFTNFGLRRCESMPKLNRGNTEDFATECGLDGDEVRRLGPEIYPGGTITKTTSVDQLDLIGIYDSENKNATSSEEDYQSRFGTREYIAEDLRRLTATHNVESALVDIKDEDAELPPLLQALVKTYVQTTKRTKTEKVKVEIPVKKVSSVLDTREIKSKTPMGARRSSVAAALLDLNLKSLDSRLKSSSSRRSSSIQSPVLESLLPSPKRHSLADVDENLQEGLIDATYAFKLQEVIEEDEADDSETQTETAVDNFQEVPQPAVFQMKLFDKSTVRLADVRVSNRVSNTSLTLECVPTIYNDMTSEIDNKTVTWLDRNLFVGEEVKSVYEEVMKSIDRDHLIFDQGDNLEPCPESINLSDFMISATLKQKPRHRIINRGLQSNKKHFGRHTAEMWAKRDRLLEQRMNMKDILKADPTRSNQNKELRAYASWLAAWKSHISSGDYVKYLSQQESDFLSVLFHFYNSDDEDSDEEDKRCQPDPEELERQRIHQEKLQNALNLKSVYESGYWNVNTVALGGLGQDPDVDVEPVPQSDKDGKLSAYRARRDPTRLSKSSKTLSLQDRLSNVWTSLWLPEAHRIDMALKYSSDKFRKDLEKVVIDWEEVTDIILRRESIIARLEAFERTASDPKRFFLKGSKGSSVHRLTEAKERSQLYNTLQEIEPQITDTVQKIETKYGDVVAYQGRPYLDKIKRDKVEMLYWLHQERRQAAIENDISNQFHRGSPNRLPELMAIDANALL